MKLPYVTIRRIPPHYILLSNQTQKLSWALLGQSVIEVKSDSVIFPSSFFRHLEASSYNFLTPIDFG